MRVIKVEGAISSRLSSGADEEQGGLGFPSGAGHLQRAAVACSACGAAVTQSDRRQASAIIRTRMPYELTDPEKSLLPTAAHCSLPGCLSSKAALVRFQEPEGRMG